MIDRQERKDIPVLRYSPSVVKVGHRPGLPTSQEATTQVSYLTIPSIIFFWINIFLFTFWDETPITWIFSFFWCYVTTPIKLVTYLIFKCIHKYPTQSRVWLFVVLSFSSLTFFTIISILSLSPCNDFLFRCCLLSSEVPIWLFCIVSTFMLKTCIFSFISGVWNHCSSYFKPIFLRHLKVSTCWLSFPLSIVQNCLVLFISTESVLYS